jgi:hypothetical protein
MARAWRCARPGCREGRGDLLLDILASGNPKRIALHHGPLFLPMKGKRLGKKMFRDGLANDFATSEFERRVFCTHPCHSAYRAPRQKAAREPPFFFAVSRSLR